MPPSASLSPGSTLGAFTIQSLVGVGGMGEVYRAVDAHLGREVALKILPAAVAGDAERVARFELEAKTLASLNHPNIATIHGLERAGGLLALVMELVDGTTLAERIADGRMPLDDALPIARQVAEALEAAHEHGVVHRDLKPANVKVRADGLVKVLDFGLAKAFEPAGADGGLSQLPTITTPAMTRAGVVLGTAAYMSPEQSTGSAVDQRTDIWAFGCVLFEMLTGRRAFAGDDVIDTLAQVRRADPDWSALPEATPPAIRRLLRRCLAKARKARVADAASLRLDIDEAAAPEPQAAAPSTPSTNAPTTTARAGRAVWPLAFGAGGVLVGLAVAMSFMAPRVPAPPPELRFDVAEPADAINNPLAVSPDGRRVAFIAGPIGKARVWVHTLSTGVARALEGTTGADDRVFWSPNGAALGFFGNGKLHRVDLESGAVQTLTDAGLGTGGSWSREGVILFSTRGPIRRVTQSGGVATTVTRLDPTETGERHASPQLLPDGRHFLSFWNGGSEVRGVYVADVDGHDQPRRLMDADAAAVFATSGHLLFPRNGALMAQRFDVERLQVEGDSWQVADSVRLDENQGHTVASTAADVLVYRRDSGAVLRRLMWRDRAGRDLGQLDARAPANAIHLSLSPDGRQLAASGRGVWLIDVARGVPTRIASGDEDGYAVWEPGDDALVFTRLVDGVQEPVSPDDRWEEPIAAQHARLEGRTRFHAGRSPAALSGHRGGHHVRSMDRLGRVARRGSACGGGRQARAVRANGCDGAERSVRARRSLGGVRVRRVGAVRDLRAAVWPAGCEASCVDRRRPLRTLGSRRSNPVLPGTG
jgi:Tol biopolymer transport system component